ncbi:proton-conducting transporter membrane subunit [Anaerolineales bacterium HSG24]|nr:proton-conducting transporter membrane subunit [Anaerolineales bacterium HSG24]
MPPVIWPIIIPIGIIPIVYLFRRTQVGAFIATFTALEIGWLIVQLEPDFVVDILGHALTLNSFSQTVLALIAFFAAIFFLISALSPSFIEEKAKRVQLRQQKRHRKAHGGIQGQEGRTLYPVGLALLSLFIVLSLTHHLGITALLMQVAAILIVFVIQGGRLVSIRAALQFLSLMSLATPMLLLAAWQFDTYQYQTRPPFLPDTYQQTALLVGLGFALWLAIVPFHSSLTATAADSYPATSAFVLLTVPAIALMVFMPLLENKSAIFEYSPFFENLLIAAFFTAFMGGMLAGIQRGFSQLMGYAALYDLGCLLLIIALKHQEGVTMLLVNLSSRAIALSLLATGMAALRASHARDGFVELTGMAWKMPFATLGLFFGGATLVGLPFTAGLMTRWEILAELASWDVRLTILLGLAGLAVFIGYLRGIRHLLDDQNGDSTVQIQEPLGLLVLIIGLIIINLLVSVFPNNLLELIASIYQP